MVSAPRFTLMLLLSGAGWLLAAQSQPNRTSSLNGNERVAAGKKAFVANCTGCHGLDASGGDRAPGISAGSEAAKLSDIELNRTIKNGIAGAGMPPFATLGDAQIRSIVAYLRDLQGKAGTEKAPGDPQQGAALFFGKARCAECHMAVGRGGFIASDLTDYAASRTPAEIRQAITAPATNHEREGKRAVVETRRGEKFSGVVRNEDNFSLAMQTTEGKFLLLEKSDLAQISYTSEPLMPTDYNSTLTSRELDDLVSYLMQLRRKRDPAASQNAARRGWGDED
jgi:cytochrome c oxidase cbb3-type subunit III